MCSAKGEKCILQCPKLNIQNKIYTNVSVFNTSPKIAHNFQEILPYFVNL